MKLKIKTIENPLIASTLVLNHSVQDINIKSPRSKWLMSLGLATLLISGCSQPNSEFEPEQSSADVDYATTEQAVVETQADTSDNLLDAPSSESKAESLSVENLSNDSEETLGSQVADLKIAGKKLLITASATFKVEDVVKSSNTIENLTYQQGGYVASNTISNLDSDSRQYTQGDKIVTLTTYNRQAEMVVRVPKVNVNKFLKQVQQQVAFLNEQQFSAQDVTLDIYRQQLASQLGSDMANELGQQRLDSTNAEGQSSNVDAITATYAARQQQEFARLEQMNIADRVKYSTITLTFTQPDISYKETTQNIDLLVEAERPSFAVEIAQALKEGWNTLREVTITLIRLWWLVIIFAAFYLLYRLIKMLYRQLTQRNRVRNARLNQAKIKAKRSPDAKVVDNKTIDDGHL